MKLLHRLFEIPPEPRSIAGVILWWEFRRPAYWAYLTVVGMAGMALIAFSMRPPTDGEEGWEPFLAIFLGIFGANFCYTGGWVAELVARKLWREKVTFFGPVAFSLGLIFTALVCLLFPLIFALCSL